MKPAGFWSEPKLSWWQRLCLRVRKLLGLYDPYVVRFDHIKTVNICKGFQTDRADLREIICANSLKGSEDPEIVRYEGEDSRRFS